MLEIPRIAVFKPPESLSEIFSLCFPREHYSIRAVEELNEIPQLIMDEAASFDAIVVPVDGNNLGWAISLAKNIKNEPQFKTITVLALGIDLTSHDVVELYEAGLDYVFTAPFDAERIHLQIGAFHRVKLAFDTERQRAVENSGLRLSSMRALNLVREGIVLFEPALTTSFISTSAGRLLGIDWETPQTSVDATFARITPFIEEHIRASAVTDANASGPLPLSIIKTQITRADNRKFESSLRILTITGVGMEIVGYAVSISDLTEFDVLSSILVQSQRTRALSLLSSGACVKLAQQKNMSFSPSQLFRDLTQTSANRSSCSATLTALLEYLDLILSTNTVVTINQPEDYFVGVKFEELFQLLGLLILEASDHAGPSGEIALTFSAKEGSKIKIRITSHAMHAVPFAPADDFASLLQGSMELAEDPRAKISSGWTAAQSIAAQYGASIKRDNPDDFSLVFDLQLPVVE